MKFLFFLFVLSFSVLGQDLPSPSTDSGSLSEKNRSGIYFQVSSATVDSATYKNTFGLRNSLFLNNSLQSSTYLGLPQNSEFRGNLAEFGWRGSWGTIFSGKFTLGGGSLTNENPRFFETSSASIRFGTTTLNSSSTNGSFMNSTKLNTARLAYIGTLTLLGDHPSPFLRNLGLDFGIEAIGNQILSKQDWTLSTSGASLLQREFKNTDGFGNGVVGVSYSVSFASRHKLDFAYHLFETVSKVDGDFSEKSTSFLTIPSGQSAVLLPSTLTFTGKQSVQNSGNRLNLGYSFFFTESVSLRLSTTLTQSTYEVQESTLKGQLNFLSLLSSGSNATNSLLASALPAFGPFPSNKDSRNQISLELAYHY